MPKKLEFCGNETWSELDPGQRMIPTARLSVNDLLRLVQDAEQTLADQSPIYESCVWVTKLIRGMLGDDEVTSAMASAPVTARPDDSLQHVALLMLKNQVHHLPITSPDGKVVGVISSIDFVRFVAQSS